MGILRRLDELMRSSLSFRAGYLVLGFIAVFEINRWFLALTGMSYTNPWAVSLELGLLLTYVFPILGIPWRRWVPAITAVVVVAWVQPHMNVWEQTILATAIVVVVVVFHRPKKTHAGQASS